jgi:hypothetical protein
VTKSGGEIMEILEAFDLTGCAHSAAQLAGTDRKTVCGPLMTTGAQLTMRAVANYIARYATRFDGRSLAAAGRASFRPESVLQLKLISVG